RTRSFSSSRARSEMSSQERATTKRASRAATVTRRASSRSSVLRVDVLERVLRGGVGASEGELERVVDDTVCFAIEPSPLVVCQGELCAQVLDRVARLLQLPQFVLVAVDLWVADVVAGQALRLADYQHGTAAAGCVGERVERGQVYRLNLLPDHVQRVHG